MVTGQLQLRNIKVKTAYGNVTVPTSRIKMITWDDAGAPPPSLAGKW